VSDEVAAAPAPDLLAVVAEDRATAGLYRTGQAFVLETLLWPAMWGTDSRFTRVLTEDQARAWLAGHGLTEVEL
jgi:hypothetical protein